MAYDEANQTGLSRVEQLMVKHQFASAGDQAFYRDFYERADALGCLTPDGKMIIKSGREQFGPCPSAGG